MRILAYIIETLVLGFMITAVVFMSMQPHIDVAKRDKEALQDGADGLDRLNGILDADTTQAGTDTLILPKDSLR